MRDVWPVRSDVQRCQESHSTVANKQLARLAVATACLSYCCWGSKNILFAWQVNHFDQWGWIAALIWFSPAAIAWFVDRKRLADLERASTLMIFGIVLTAIGHLSTLNVASNLGLVVVLSSGVVRSYKQLPWLVAGVCWIPAFGWLGSKMFVDHVLLMRIAVASFGLVWMCTYYTLKTFPNPETQPKFGNS
jgi:hypothetical protein